MSSNLWVKNGIYDPSKRFAFTNIDTEPFTFYWNKQPITVKVNETVELPHYLAVHATTQLVDKLMIGAERVKTLEIQKTNPSYKAPNAAGSLAVPAAREPWEKKVLKELPPRDDSDAQLQVIRAQVAAELTHDLEEGKKTPKSMGKVSDLGVDSKVFEDINLPHKDN